VSSPKPYRGLTPKRMRALLSETSHSWRQQRLSPKARRGSQRHSRARGCAIVMAAFLVRAILPLTRPSASSSAPCRAPETSSAQNDAGDTTKTHSSGHWHKNKDSVTAPSSPSAQREYDTAPCRD